MGDTSRSATVAVRSDDLVSAVLAVFTVVTHDVSANTALARSRIFFIVLFFLCVLQAHKSVLAAGEPVCLPAAVFMCKCRNNFQREQKKEDFFQVKIAVLAELAIFV